MSRVFFVGAGASAAAPAELPLFGRLRSHLLSRLALDNDAKAVAETLAPEVLMRVLYEGLLPLESWLTETLSRGEPNAVHWALAAGLQSGAHIWTVNVDEHIESAAAMPAIGAAVTRAAYPDGELAFGANVLKPHGTVSSGRYVFRADQVLKPLPAPWANRLSEDLCGADVIVLGYQAADIDIRLSLQEALAGSASITWFSPDSEWPDHQQRLPALRLPNVRHVGARSGPEVTQRFLEWAHREGLTTHTPVHVTDAVNTTPNPSVDDIVGDVRLARALLYERAGDRAEARYNLHRVVVASSSIRAKRKALRRLTTLAMYEPTRTARCAYAVAASPLRGIIPRTIRNRLDRAHVTLLGSHQGKHEEAQLRANRALNQNDPALVIARSKAARYRGEMPTAIDLATQAYDLAEDAELVDEAAHALFELVLNHTWRGDYESARQALGRLHHSRDALAGVRWIGWAEWLAACLELHEARPINALAHLDSAILMFKADHLPAGEVAALTTKLTGYRMLGDDRAFESARNALNGWRGSRGWTVFTDHAIELEVVEFDRRRGAYSGLRARIGQLVDETLSGPHHRAVALLGLAELMLATGDDNESTLADTEWVASTHELRYVTAHAAITRYRSGLLTASEALDRVRRSGCHLTTRHGGAANDPTDYCLGSCPHLHELFFPT